MGNRDIQDMLKLSYDGLDKEEKEIFLDIACFFKGRRKRYVIAWLERFRSCVSVGLTTLVNKALISIDDYDKVQMHDLIQSMAFEIVCQECENNPGGRSRLWNPTEICQVLNNNRGTEAIEAISLDLSQIDRDLQLNADTFGKMTNLKYLKFYKPYMSWRYRRYRHERSCSINLPSGLKSFPTSLMYLRWDSFPGESLPLSLCAETIVKLHMPHSRLKKLWDGVLNLVELRKIDFSGSLQLIELPDLSTAKKLESINLNGCERLCHFHPSILSLPSLRKVTLRHCRELKSLKSMDPSKSLPYLDIYGCDSLEEFSFSSDKITHLSLLHARVERLDFSMGHMGKLQNLHLNCSRLQSLPINDICCMTSLVDLRLSNCGETIDKSKLHSLFDSLKSLTTVSLNGAFKLTALPNNIKHLSRLRSLSVRDCEDLQSLPELPPSIEELDASNCTSLETLQFTSHHIESSLSADETMLGSTFCSSISYLTNLRELNLSGCQQLCLPDCIKHLSSLRSLSVSDCKDLQSLPELPPSIETLDASNCTSLETLQFTCHVESSFGYLTNLQYLKLRGCLQLWELPESIKNLLKLTDIVLTDCTGLRSLLELPPSIETIVADGCISLGVIPSLITSAPQLSSLYLRDCLKLENRSLSHVMECAYFSLKRSIYTKGSGRVCYPGTQVSQRFKFIKGEKPYKCTYTLPSSSTTNNLIGFILYTVHSHLPHIEDDLRCFVIYNDGKPETCPFLGYEQMESRLSYEPKGKKELDSLSLKKKHHVFLWFINLNERMVKPGFPEVSFKFSLNPCDKGDIDGDGDGGDYDGDGDGGSGGDYDDDGDDDDDDYDDYDVSVIEECGVCPIYASEYRDFIEEMELKKSNLALGTQKDTCHDDADENSFQGILQYARSSLNQQKRGNFEGSIIPDWFTCKISTISYGALQVTIDLASDFDDLMGFIFCFVIPNFSSKERDQCHSSCECGYMSDMYDYLEGPRGWHYSMEELNSNNVFLWYDPLYCGRILHNLQKRNTGKCQYITFSFQFGEGLINKLGSFFIGDCLIKECGVRPIYVSEYTNFLQQKNKLKVSIDDDQHQLPSTKKLEESSINQPIPLDSESENSHNVEVDKTPQLLKTYSTKRKCTTTQDLFKKKKAH